MTTTERFFWAQITVISPKGFTHALTISCTSPAEALDIVRRDLSPPYSRYVMFNMNDEKKVHTVGRVLAFPDNTKDVLTLNGNKPTNALLFEDKQSLVVFLQEACVANETRWYSLMALDPRTGMRTKLRIPGTHNDMWRLLDIANYMELCITDKYTYTRLYQVVTFDGVVVLGESKMRFAMGPDGRGPTPKYDGEYPYLVLEKVKRLMRARDFQGKINDFHLNFRPLSRV